MLAPPESPSTCARPPVNSPSKWSTTAEVSLRLRFPIPLQWACWACANVPLCSGAVSKSVVCAAPLEPRCGFPSRCPQPVLTTSRIMKILLTDDHAVVRHGLKQILADEFKRATFGEARNAQEALNRVWKETWDVV